MELEWNYPDCWSALPKFSTSHPPGSPHGDSVFPRQCLSSGNSQILASLFMFWWNRFLFVLFTFTPGKFRGTASLHQPASVRTARRVHSRTTGARVPGWSCLLRRPTFFTRRTGHVASVLISPTHCLTAKAQKCYFRLTALKRNFLHHSIFPQTFIMRQWVIILAFIVFHWNTRYFIQEQRGRTPEGLEWGGRVFSKIKSGLRAFKST